MAEVKLPGPVSPQVDPSRCYLFAADGKALAPLGKAAWQR